eukprot:363282-Chlamydomonas_euryale.AAC.2
MSMCRIWDKRIRAPGLLHLCNDEGCGIGATTAHTPCAAHGTNAFGLQGFCIFATTRQRRVAACFRCIGAMTAHNRCAVRRVITNDSLLMSLISVWDSRLVVQGSWLAQKGFAGSSFPGGLHSVPAVPAVPAVPPVDT